MDTITTGTIEQGHSLGSGPLWILRIETDRKPLARGGYGKGKPGGTLTANTLPALLSSAAELMKQEGLTTLDELADLTKAVGRATRPGLS